jgi:hypothetical protein
MARAWFVAEQPTPAEKLPKLGGFDEWVRIVGGILEFSDLPGFLANQQDIYDLVDDEGPQWRGFLQAWFEQMGGKPEPVTVRYLAGFRANPQPNPLLEALPESVGWDEKNLDNSRKRLGKALKKHASRVYGQRRREHHSQRQSPRPAGEEDPRDGGVFRGQSWRQLRRIRPRCSWTLWRLKGGGQIE